MDNISDEQKLKWLTTTVPARERAMVNTGNPEDPENLGDSWLVPKYRITRLRRQIHQPSFGDLGKLPPELLAMVFRHLTCGDLEAIHSCSTGGRIAVLAFPQYQTLLQHAPTILAILKETRLVRSFTITQIYETFTSPLCTNCGQFGGYVFLPSFSRCCMQCAETDLKFMPISRDGAKIEFGVKGKKIFDGLTPFNNIEGYYSSFSGEIKYYSQKLVLYSREPIEKLRNPKHELVFARHSQSDIGRNSIKGHQRFMALTPLPCFIPKSASMEKGVYCAGCSLRSKEHGPCQGTHISEYRSYVHPEPPHVTDGFHFSRCYKESHELCILLVDQDRLHDSRSFLKHVQDCEAAQALLKAKWTRSQNKKTYH